MKRIKKILFTISILLAYFISIAMAPSAAQVKVNVSGLKSVKGNLIVTVFQTQEQFEKEKPYKVFTVSKKNVKSGRIYTQISLPIGDYGIVVVDDANANNKMDYRGPIPKEGFGFSNYELSGLKKPTLSQFIFHLASSKSVYLKMKYI